MYGWACPAAAYPQLTPRHWETHHTASRHARKPPVPTPAESHDVQTPYSSLLPSPPLRAHSSTSPTFSCAAISCTHVCHAISCTHAVLPLCRTFSLQYGCIPLHLAASIGNRDMVDALLEPFEGEAVHMQRVKRSDYVNQQDSQVRPWRSSTVVPLCRQGAYRLGGGGKSCLAWPLGYRQEERQPASAAGSLSDFWRGARGWGLGLFQGAVEGRAVD